MRSGRGRDIPPNVLPLISVVVPTRNRAAHVQPCVRAILASGNVREVVVVDQSDDHSTRDELALMDDPRVRHIPTPTRGVGSGRNVGIAHSRSDVIAFTDDDCRPAHDWGASLARAFEDDPAAAVVCGRVIVPEELWDKGFVESFEPRVREWQGSYPPFGQDWGITANLAVRKSTFDRVGVFDPMLGAGGPLRSGGEPDFLFRVLRAGLKVVNAREVQVEHLGVRPYGAEAQKLLRGYGHGTGAALFKHVRLGDPHAIRLYARFVGANVRRIVTNLATRGQPTGAGYLVAFLGGAAASFEFRVDRNTRAFVARE